MTIFNRYLRWALGFVFALSIVAAAHADPLRDQGAQRLRQLIQLQESMQQQARLQNTKPPPQYYFTTAYVYVTQNLLAMADSGAFEHDAWALMAIDEFAKSYLNNAKPWLAEDKKSVEPHWRTAFERMEMRPAYRVDRAGVALVEGVRAHISVDLARALRTSYLRSQGGPGPRFGFEALRPDFERMLPAFEQARKTLSRDMPLIPERVGLLLFNAPGTLDAKRGRVALAAVYLFDIPAERAIAFYRAAAALGVSVPLEPQDRALIQQLSSTELWNFRRPGVDLVVRDYEIGNVLRIVDALTGPARDEAIAWLAKTPVAKGRKTSLLDYLLTRSKAAQQQAFTRLIGEMKQARDLQQAGAGPGPTLKPPDSERNVAPPPPPPPPPPAAGGVGGVAKRGGGKRKPHERDGGIRLDRTAEWELPELLGVRMEQNQLVLLTRAGPRKLPVDMGLFGALLKTLASGDDPYVSIDPGPDPSRGYVRLPPALRSTRVGKILLDADVRLKSLYLGLDVYTRKRLESPVPGWRSGIDLLRSRRLSHSSGMVQHRFWITPKRVVLRAHGTSAVVEEVEMQVKWERMSGPPNTAFDRVAADFARHLSEHWKSYRSRYVEFARVEALARWTAVARFIRDRKLPVDPSWLDDSNIAQAHTPQTTPALKREVTHQGFQLRVTGGVDFSPENQYAHATGPLSACRSAGPEGCTRRVLTLGRRFAALEELPVDAIEQLDPTPRRLGELTLRKPSSWLVAPPDVRQRFRTELEGVVGPNARLVGDLLLLQPRPDSFVVMASLPLPVGAVGIDLWREQLRAEFGTAPKTLRWFGQAALSIELPARSGQPSTRVVWIVPPKQGRAYLVAVSSLKGPAARDRLLERTRTLLSYRRQPTKHNAVHALRGGVKPGMTRADVQRRLGSPDESLSDPGGALTAWAYARAALVLIFDRNGVLASITAFGPGAPRLENGLGIGARRSDIESRYPKTCTMVPAAEPRPGSATLQGVDEVVWCPAERLMFLLSKGRVARFVTHRDADEAFALEQILQRLVRAGPE